MSILVSESVDNGPTLRGVGTLGCNSSTLSTMVGDTPLRVCQMPATYVRVERRADFMSSAVPRSLQKTTTTTCPTSVSLLRLIACARRSEKVAVGGNRRRTNKEMPEAPAPHAALPFRPRRRVLPPDQAHPEGSGRSLHRRRGPSEVPAGAISFRVNAPPCVSPATSDG